ncbi:MAG: amino acid ABC transporter substrate-binding protein [Paracoccus sp. (in: a-proteobacteria)]|uniref:amino acid ABC transporter substrate-binding protein n=1 Tax=Paracoccus sp. TaxID=267 RepID=UPI0026DF62C7|nr:amino acid ABC transporter substrate-binding protein [Paracoccus sp. (in: a-proteobacteria)]MDO5620725.1 amino acid ABC transporter substrate-binding protein [Paracoccus sp. (in: a-proteobacteria)]
MTRTALFATLAACALGGAALAESGETLTQARERDVLNCGVNQGLVGFAAPDANGNWSGFDVNFCMAVAAAVLGDPAKVNYIPTSGEGRFEALTSGQVDLLARNSTWTFSRDAELDFGAVSYYDGQGFMLRKTQGISSAKELDGTSICVQSGTTTAINLADYFRANNMKYTAVPVNSSAEGEQKYVAGACDAYTADISGLAATRAAFADPENHIILPEVISKEPLAAVARQGDDNWSDILRWTMYALIAAEEYGVTSANIEELSRSSQSAEVQRLLGMGENDLGALLGLDRTWAKRAISASGNYGEIFAATIGEQTPIGLPRGLNAQWTQGGLMYAPPFH